MHKLLVANRGEIAVRVLRAANELQLQTVCVYTPEDGEALHRTKADEAYQLGEPGHPVRGYLDVDALLEVALRSGADALHPGYGVLSESAAPGAPRVPVRARGRRARRGVRGRGRPLRRPARRRPAPHGRQGHRPAGRRGRR